MKTLELGLYKEPYTTNTVAITEDGCFRCAIINEKLIITNEKVIVLNRVLKSWEYSPFKRLTDEP
jgi:hypothetical protein